jgi:osmoprotectant transport system ATP-binding protein
MVTHDLDEAVRLGDRIAVMRQGGYLEQYDTPARILAEPATEFVTDFVGEDRLLKLMAVTAVDIEALAPVQPEDVHLPTLPAGSTLREAVIAVLGSPTGRIRIEGAGRSGVLTMADVRTVLRPDVPTGPT